MGEIKQTALRRRLDRWEAQGEHQQIADAVLALPAAPGSALFDEGCPCDKDHFKAAHPDTDWETCLEHAEKLGLGSREYELVKI